MIGRSTPHQPDAPARELPDCRVTIDSLPLYPEARACRRPTARKVIDLFEDVQRHELSGGSGWRWSSLTKLSRLQRRVLRLPTMRGAYDT